MIFGVKKFRKGKIIILGLQIYNNFCDSFSCKCSLCYSIIQTEIYSMAFTNNLFASKLFLTWLNFLSKHYSITNSFSTLLKWHSHQSQFSIHFLLIVHSSVGIWLFCKHALWEKNKPSKIICYRDRQRCIDSIYIDIDRDILFLSQWFFKWSR